MRVYLLRTGECKYKLYLLKAFKNVETSSSVDRLLMFKAITPRRIVGFATGFTLEADKCTVGSEVFWDQDTQADLSFNVSYMNAIWVFNNYFVKEIYYDSTVVSAQKGCFGKVPPVPVEAME